MMRLLLSALSASLIMPARCLMSSLAGLGLRRAVSLRAAPTASAAPTAVARREVGSPLPPTPGAEGCVYLDYAATCPIYPDVAAAMLPYFTTQWGNPSSPHAFGRQSKLACDGARARVAELLECAPSEVIFTSCGSESDNWAIVSAVELARAWLPAAELPHIVTSTIEHPAIALCVDALVAQGRATATKVGVDCWGRVDPAAVAAAMRPSTALVTIMHANNEVGTIQPLAAIAAAARAASPRALVHTDAAQSVGKVAVSAAALGVDMLTLVGHKFGAPKGCAALFVRDGLALPQMLRGGGQERGRRAGTECVPLIVGLGEASAVWNEQGGAIAAHSAAMRARLLAALTARLGAERLRVNSPLDAAPAAAAAAAGAAEWASLPNVLSVGVRGAASGAVLAALAERVAASAGAACHSHEQHASGGAVSGVLGELGVPREFALGTLRLSVGRHTTADEVDLAAALIADAVLAADARGRT